jgi:hypothetical protein
MNGVIEKRKNRKRETEREGRGGNLLLVEGVIECRNHDGLSLGEALTELVLVIVAFFEFIFPLLLSQLEQERLLLYLRERERERRE